eukprot:9448618-Pyramimonas_sp.AAC.1
MQGEVTPCFCVYDCRAVVDGWHARVYLNPRGALGPIWPEIGKLLSERDPSFITVLWGPSDLEAGDALSHE